MEGALVALALLACPVGMGLMMWFMGKNMVGGKEQPRNDERSVEELRDEQARLRAQIDQLEARARAHEDEPLSHS